MDNPDTYSIGHKIQNEYKTKQNNTTLETQKMSNTVLKKPKWIHLFAKGR
jgi:hypothetical protein